MNKIVVAAMPLLLIWTLVTSVGCDRRADEVKARVSWIAENLNKDLEGMRASTVAFVAEAAKLYSHLDQYDLSTQGMDVKEGGVFDTFAGNKFYYKTVEAGASVYASPLKPVDDRLKKAIKTILHLEGPLKASYEAHQDLLNASFFGVHEPSSIAILYPFQDVVSHLPPGLDLHVLEWYTRGLNSSGQSLWSKGPFVSLYGGWVEDLAAPVVVEGRTVGVQVMIVGMEMVKAKYITKEAEQVFLLGPDLTLVAANASAQKALGLRVLEDIDYVKQMKENSFAPAVYQLSDPGQTEGLRSVASKIHAGEASFEASVAGTDWRFFVGSVKETGFYVVGFLQK